MDEADDFAVVIKNWEMLEARTIEPVEGERAEHFVVLDVDDFLGWEHDVGGGDVGQIEQVRDHFALALAEDAGRSLIDDFEKFSASFRRVVDDG